MHLYFCHHVRVDDDLQPGYSSTVLPRLHTWKCYFGTVLGAKTVSTSLFGLTPTCRTYRTVHYHHFAQLSPPNWSTDHARGSDDSCPRCPRHGDPAVHHLRRSIRNRGRFLESILSRQGAPARGSLKAVEFRTKALVPVDRQDEPSDFPQCVEFFSNSIFCILGAVKSMPLRLDPGFHLVIAFLAFFCSVARFVAL